MTDATVVGSGPNGLAAALTLATAGLDVTVLEAADQLGGSARSSPLVDGGPIHDHCAAVHPFAVSSPFFSALDLARDGLTWVHPRLALAHPLDGQPAVLLHTDLDATAAGIGTGGAGWRTILGPLARRWPRLAGDVLAPQPHRPADPAGLAWLGLTGTWSARRLASTMRGTRAQALLAGLAGHAGAALERPVTAGVALTLAAAGHAVGWPVARGGSQAIPDALARRLAAHGGRVVTGRRVDSLEELDSDVVLLDVTPRQLLALAGQRLPTSARRALERFRPGPGVCKVDYVLDGPVPWRDPRCADAGTVHLGGTFEEIAAYQRTVAAGRLGTRPFVIAAQQSLVDSSRTPDSRQALWAYCHVPRGSPRPVVELVADAVDTQIERFAPGFRDRVLARVVRGPAELERHNPNLAGGDITGGATDGLQLFFRPVRALVPYRTPLPGVYLCSSSTPPGPGVHGMCGHHAARQVLRDLAGRRPPERRRPARPWRGR